jgi:uncharacterized protein involved in outer membrane biogenesis
MKKLLIIGGILVGLLVITFVTLSFFLGSIVKAGVNKFGPQITQTKFELQGAAISPLNGSGTLNGLVIGNPKGWSEGNLCSLGKIHVEMKPFSVLGDHIVVDTVDIDAPEFTYETKFVSSNVNDLLKNIEQAMGSGGTATQPQKGGKPIKFEVKKFRITNGVVRLSVPGAAAMSMPMPTVELTDLGTKEGGITPDQLAFAVMRSVTASVVAASTQALTSIGGTSGAAAVEGAKQVGDAIKGLFQREKKK